MGLLDAYAIDLRTTAENSFAPPQTPAAPGVWKNFAPGAGSVFMQGLAQVARAGSMAMSTVPRVADALIGDDNRGESFTDAYFRKVHDPVFQSAVDYWTPKPNEVGAAGQVVGGLAAGMAQFAISPSLMVGTSMLSTSEDLVRQGVKADAALVAGDVAGLANVAGIAMPFLGKSLASRMVSGAAGNLATGAAQAGITHGVLAAAGAPQAVLAQHDWADLQARGLDVLLGLAFGGAAHLSAVREAKAQAFADGPIPSQRTAVADAAAQAVDNPLNMSATQRDALMVLNQARHLDDLAARIRPPGTPDHVDTVDAVNRAVGQIAAGRTVDGPPVDRRSDMPPTDHEAEMPAIAEATLPKPQEPIPAPEMRAPDMPAAPQADGGLSQTVPRFADDLRLPAADFDPSTGAPRTVSANEHIAAAMAEANHVKSTSERLMQAAATCLLGGV